MNPKKLNDKIQAINRFEWNQKSLIVEPYGKSGIRVKPAQFAGIISSAFLENLRENGLIFFVDSESLVVYY